MAIAMPSNLRHGSIIAPSISVNGVSNILTTEINGTMGNRLRVPNFNREILSRSRQEIASKSSRNCIEEESDLR